MSSSSSSLSSFPPIVPQHCLNVPLLYEMLKGEEEPCRMWLREEMNQIADPLIDSLFHGLIMMSSSSSSAVPQSRPTVSELCELLKGEKVLTRSVLKGKMDRLVNTLFERLTNKLRMTNEDFDRSEDGGERAQVGNLLDQVESANPQPDPEPSSLNSQPSTSSSFNLVPHPQHSSGNEVQLNIVEMIEIKEEVEDGEETRIIDMETLSQDYQIKREIEEEGEMTLNNDQIGDWVKREIKEEEENGETQVDDIEGWSQDNQVGGNESRSANESNEVTTVTQSADLLSPSTSTGNGSNRTALNQQANATTQHNKRKQPPTKRSTKRSKKTLQDEDGDDGGDIANEDPEEAKVKVVYLNCNESNCNVKMTSLDHFYDHLSTVHRLSPFQCFATNCNARFHNRIHIRDHIQLNHPQDARFLCAVCSTEYVSQNKAYTHWHQSHQNGQFMCNFVSDCTEVTDTRRKMITHQRVKHYSQSKHCTHPGCTASFSCNAYLKRHELTHLATNQFHCIWPHCSKQCKVRSNLVKHIRTKHFGLPRSMKEQKAKNIVDLRDPNEYVRVVVDE